MMRPGTSSRGLVLAIILTLSATSRLAAQLVPVRCDLPLTLDDSLLRPVDDGLLGEVFTAKGEHYRVESEVSQPHADWMLHLLETAWPLFGDRFGLVAAPPEGSRHFLVKVYKTRMSFELAASADWPDCPDLSTRSAAFVTSSGALHVLNDGLPVRGRMALFHVAAQQYYYFSVCGGQGDFVKLPAWLSTGIAHDLERHAVDGKQLRLGTDAFPYMNFLGVRALRVLKDESFDLRRFLSTPERFSLLDDMSTQGIGWMIVKYFREHRKPALVSWFADLERTLSSSLAPEPWFLDRLDAKEVRADLERFIEHRMRLARLEPKGEWTWPAKTTFAAHLSDNHFCHLPLAQISGPVPFSFEFRISRPLLESEAVGVVIGDVPRELYHVLLLSNADRFLYFVKRDGDDFSESQDLPIAAPVTGKRFRLDYDGDEELKVTIGDRITMTRRVNRSEIQGVVGLYFEERPARKRNLGATRIGSFRFEELVWKANEPDATLPELRKK